MSRKSSANSPRIDIRVGPSRDTPGWSALRRYYVGLEREERESFVNRLGTTDGYLRTALHRGTIGPAIALRIEKRTRGAITRDMICLRWREIWPDWVPVRRGDNARSLTRPRQRPRERRARQGPGEERADDD
jgi:hypothetical protein